MVLSLKYFVYFIIIEEYLTYQFLKYFLNYVLNFIIYKYIFKYRTIKYINYLLIDVPSQVSDSKPSNSQSINGSNDDDYGAGC